VAQAARAGCVAEGDVARRVRCELDGSHYQRTATLRGCRRCSPRMRRSCDPCPDRHTLPGRQSYPASSRKAAIGRCSARVKMNGLAKSLASSEI
jgi:hypothetical protein